VQDPPAHPDKWRSPASFTEFFKEELRTEVEPEAARIGVLGRLVAGVAFLAVLVPLLYVVWFLSDWLGIQDDEGLVGVLLLGLGITPAILAWGLITDAFRRRNLARRRSGSRPGSHRGQTPMLLRVLATVLRTSIVTRPTGASGPRSGGGSVTCPRTNWSARGDPSILIPRARPCACAPRAYGCCGPDRDADAAHTLALLTRSRKILGWRPGRR
jgi:hypothetical protein